MTKDEMREMRRTLRQRRRFRFFGTKARTATTIVAASALLAGTAFAIFVNLPVGTGNTNATVGSTSSDVTVTITGGGTAYAPSGGVAQALQPDTTPPTGTAGNGTTEEVIYWSITTPTAATVKTATAAPATDGSTPPNVMNFVGNLAVPGCLASWFIVSPTMETTAGNTTLAADIANEHPLVGTNLVPGTPTTVFSTIYLYDSTGSTNQDNCENVSPSITLAIN